MGPEYDFCPVRRAKLMNQSHETIAWVLIVLIVLHIAGAIKHHFIDKDNVLKRMLPGSE